MINRASFPFSLVLSLGAIALIAFLIWGPSSSPPEEVPVPETHETFPSKNNLHIENTPKISSQNLRAPISDMPVIESKKVGSIWDCLSLSSSTDRLSCLQKNPKLLDNFDLKNLIQGNLPESFAGLHSSQLQSIISAMLVNASPQDCVDAMIAFYDNQTMSHSARDVGTGAFYNVLEYLDKELISSIATQGLATGAPSYAYILHAFPDVIYARTSLRNTAAYPSNSSELRAAAISTYCSSSPDSEAGRRERSLLLLEVLSPDRVSQEERGSSAVESAIYFALEAASVQDDPSLEIALRNLASSPVHGSTFDQVAKQAILEIPGASELIRRITL